MLSRSVAREENSHKGRDAVKYYKLYFKEFVLGNLPAGAKVTLANIWPII